MSALGTNNINSINNISTMEGDGKGSKASGATIATRLDGIDDVEMDDKGASSCTTMATRLDGFDSSEMDDEGASSGTTIATRLDGFDGSEMDDEGASFGTIIQQRKPGVYLTQVERAAELASAMDKGLRQSQIPTWGFTGKLSMTFANRKGDKDPAATAEHDKLRAEANGYQYHTMVLPWIQGEQQAKERLKLVGGQGNAVVIFREQIMNQCFCELEVEDWSQWEHLLALSSDWRDLAATI